MSKNSLTKNSKIKVISIVGPTAGGKTAYSIGLAKKINGEIISADSMLVYKNLNIGTAKPLPLDLDEPKHVAEAIRDEH